MPLREPPPAAELARLPGRSIVGAALHRVYRLDRGHPWWFASLPTDSTMQQRTAAGRFDLPAPDGTCYLATTPLGAVLEAFQGFGHGLLPDAELKGRRRAETTVPDGTRPAAWLTSGKVRGIGVTQALWTGQDRPLTQRWAAVLHRAGWAALFHGLQHDPTGRLRGVTLFDTGGAHPPLDDHDGWRHTDHRLHHDPALVAGLARYGIAVARSDPDLPVVTLDDSGLL
ncbi:MAG: RES domain-containing protein [Acidimicrobiia bacterium]